MGFGYAVVRRYDSHLASDCSSTMASSGPGMSFGDPQACDSDGDRQLDHVIVKSRPEQAGVRRHNDIDEFGEAFNNGAEKSSYGQPIVFDVSGSGDPFAYLHKSLPGVIDGGFAPIDSWLEGEADQTSAAALLTFTAEGDLPLSWSVKPSLAPVVLRQEGHARPTTCCARGTRRGRTTTPARAPSPRSRSRRHQLAGAGPEHHGHREPA